MLAMATLSAGVITTHGVFVSFASLPRCEAALSTARVAVAPEARRFIDEVRHRRRLSLRCEFGRSEVAGDAGAQLRLAGATTGCRSGER